MTGFPDVLKRMLNLLGLFQNEFLCKEGKPSPASPASQEGLWRLHAGPVMRGRVTEFSSKELAKSFSCASNQFFFNQ